MGSKTILEGEKRISGMVLEEKKGGNTGIQVRKKGINMKPRPHLEGAILTLYENDLPAQKFGN